MTAAAYRPWGDRLPWTPALAATAFGFNGAAVLLLLAGWYGAAGENNLSDTVPWANLSATGLALAGVGNAILLTGARARIGARQRALADAHSRRLAEWTATAGTAPAPSTALDTGSVGLIGQSLYHQDGCPLIVGKEAAVLTAREVARRTPCGWCVP